MSVTTKKGDKGMTDYFGKRVAKDADEIELLGNLDELQAVILIINYELRITNLKQVAEDLGEIMGHPASAAADYGMVTQRIKSLEKGIDKLWQELKPVTGFVIFEKEKAVQINWVRTVARRAERRAVSTGNFKDVIIYLNRLSDYLYLLALKEEK